MTIVIPRQYSAIVTANEQLTPKIYWLRVRTPEPIDYTAGQYASFLIDAARRPLSFATPAGSPELEFVIDVSPGGIASQYTMQLKAHDQIIFLAPYGRFVVDEASPRPRVFIAAGSGIAPIRAHIISELSRQADVPFTLVFGNRTSEYMFFTNELSALAVAHPNFTFIPCISEPDPTWTGERGFVSEVAQRLVPNLVESDVYVCGSPDMVTDTLAVLVQAGVPYEHVYTEQFT